MSAINVQSIASDIELLRGSLVTLRRRCGKASCRCADGEPHESPALSFSEGGRTRMLTLRAEDVEAVAAAVERYRAARAELEAAGQTGLEVLRTRVAERREQRR